MRRCAKFAIVHEGKQDQLCCLSDCRCTGHQFEHVGFEGGIKIDNMDVDQHLNILVSYKISVRNKSVTRKVHGGKDTSVSWLF